MNEVNADSLRYGIPAPNSLAQEEKVSSMSTTEAGEDGSDPHTTPQSSVMAVMNTNQSIPLNRGAEIHINLLPTKSWLTAEIPLAKMSAVLMI
jgi:hypothetical protein